MPTYGEWQDGLEHEVILIWNGDVSVVWLTESSAIQPEIGWEVLDTNVSFTGVESEVYFGAGNATPGPSGDAWDEAQVDTSLTTSGATLMIEHGGSVDNPVGGGFFNQSDSWTLVTSDAHLNFEQTPAFENPFHFLPPDDTWPSGVAGWEIENRRDREQLSIEMSYWDGLPGYGDAHYEGHFKDFGGSTAGWPHLDPLATPTSLRLYDGLPFVPLIEAIGDSWIPLNVAQAQAVIDVVQAGGTPDPGQYAMAGWVHNNESPPHEVWGAVDYSESPGLPTLWFKIRFRTTRYRFIYDGGLPPQRVFPREDGLLGPGVRRNFPPPRSRQRSPRTFGGYL